MAASLSIRVYTGASAGTQSAAQVGVDLSSDDSASNSLSHRQNNPVSVNTRSYEKWLKLLVDTAPANAVANFKLWGDGAVQTSTKLWTTGQYVTGTTPTNGASTIANTDYTNFTSGNKMSWDTNSYSATGASTQFLVFQLQVNADCGPGNWTQETANYSYDET